ncbi:MAG: hypoxanthine phosphoribosyltransferase [Candidatus Eisenbacteria sp.]|nr:hypoxanthine phosphoribosyltransferase [Candidatus Eisenbacteria bacterium]
MLEIISKLKRGDEISLTDGVGHVLFTAEDVRQRVSILGQQLAADYRDKIPVLVAILRGGFVFQCDLARAARIPQEIDFLSVSRFNPEEKGRTAVKVLYDLRSDIRGRHVIVVEGIRTGSTKMEYVRTFLELHEPATIQFAALVRHADTNDERIPLQYKGFDIGEKFVVGCGLDYQERYRNLPLIAAFTPSTKA